jgi:hypothetical protein
MARPADDYYVARMVELKAVQREFPFYGVRWKASLFPELPENHGAPSGRRR